MDDALASTINREPEFSKFVTLTKSLSPFVVVLIDPQSRSRRLDRNPTICRQNLLWVTNGHPDAKPGINSSRPSWSCSRRRRCFSLVGKNSFCFPIHWRVGSWARITERFTRL
jgi:hypothetical protein